MIFLIRGSAGFSVCVSLRAESRRPCSDFAGRSPLRSRRRNLLARGDAQIRFLVIPSVTESEVERRRVGLLVEFVQPGLIMLFEHFDGAEINAKETQIPLVRIEVGKRNA